MNAIRIKPSPPLQIGWIPYWNLVPLRREMERQLGTDVTLKTGSPTFVNKLLVKGEIGLAPCSSVCLLEPGAHELAFPLGVAADGVVGSVYLGFHHENQTILSQIRRRQIALRDRFKRFHLVETRDFRSVAESMWDLRNTAPANEPTPVLQLTPASATSAALCRVLGGLWFGECGVDFVPTNRSSRHPSDVRPIELLIGDEALIRRPQFAKVLDLAEAWNELTALPFVFALWQKCKRTLSPYWQKKIDLASRLAEAKMKVEPAVYLPRTAPLDALGRRIDLASYWKHIDYRLTERHFQGLLLFLCLARLAMPKVCNEETLTRIARWEALQSAHEFSSR